jgi:aspartyl-tRNA(Asn)/glutamyl-tRNA(Gln) amidotransferase subunit B
VRIHHAHLEEDAGKLTHHGDYSLVDLNRAGTPLIEIVSLPDMHSALEAKAYATELYRLMAYAGVTHGDLYHGNMRFDVNISIAPVGSDTLGTRTEIKNLNSFRSIERAVEYEAKRQAELLERGEAVVQETRGWDEAKQKTTSQRSKEEAQDYRYMPDPDIPPIVLSDDFITSVQSEVGMLPPEYRDKWRPLELDTSVIDALLANPSYARIVTAVRDKSDNKKARMVAHWFASSVPESEEGAEPLEIDEVPFSYIELARMVEAGELSSTGGKQIFAAMLGTNLLPGKLAEDLGVLQVSDVSAIAEIVDDILADPANQKAIEDIKNGNEKVIGFLVGQVMKQSQGKANPGLAQKLIRERL